MVKILQKKIDERTFMNWSMGFAEMTSDHLKEIDGLNDLFLGINCLSKLTSDKASMLVKAFANGQWRLN